MSAKRAKAPERRSTKGERTGGRSAAVVENVLRATLEELGKSGYAGFRIEAVAARAGVNKTTIYRRWPSKVELVSAACNTITGAQEFPNTGDLERDLVEAYSQGVRHVGTPLVRGLLQMMQAEANDPAVAAIKRELRARAAAPRLARLRAAVKRGELPRNTDVEVIHQILANAIYGRAARTDDRVTDQYIRSVITLVLRGARATRA